MTGTNRTSTTATSKWLKEVLRNKTAHFYPDKPLFSPPDHLAGVFCLFSSGPYLSIVTKNVSGRVPSEAVTQVGQGFSVSQDGGVTPRRLPADSSRREARGMRRKETQEAQDAEWCLALSLRSSNEIPGCEITV